MAFWMGGGKVSHHFLDVAGLCFAYPDGTEALNGVSFRLEHGESVGLVGANGAGKSTMLLALAGLVLPSGGTVNVGGTILARNTVGEIRKRMGFVFQDPEDQLFMPTVFDDVAFGPLNQGLSVPEVSSRVRESLEGVGAAHLSERPTGYPGERNGQLRSLRCFPCCRTYWSWMNRVPALTRRDVAFSSNC